jgi:hypothetical protein
MVHPLDVIASSKMLDRYDHRVGEVDVSGSESHVHIAVERGDNPLQALFVPVHRRPAAGDWVLAVCPHCGREGQLSEVSLRGHRCPNQPNKKEK